MCLSPISCAINIHKTSTGTFRVPASQMAFDLKSFHPRVVKILMQLPDENISAAHLTVPYNRPIGQRDSLLLLRLEITVRCLYLDDFVRHDNGRVTHAVHVVTTFRRTESTSNHGRTASYLTAPVQIPACGTTARGSSKLLASHIGQHRNCDPQKLWQIRGFWRLNTFISSANPFQL